MAKIWWWHVCSGTPFVAPPTRALPPSPRVDCVGTRRQVTPGCERSSATAAGPDFCFPPQAINRPQFTSTSLQKRAGVVQCVQCDTFAVVFGCDGTAEMCWYLSLCLYFDVEFFFFLKRVKRRKKNVCRGCPLFLARDPTNENKTDGAVRANSGGRSRTLRHVFGDAQDFSHRCLWRGRSRIARMGVSLTERSTTNKKTNIFACVCVGGVGFGDRTGQEARLGGRRGC